jgi:lipopolysaccharide biosynthesis protein
MKNLRAVAIYLPQFHPIPENDEWWGKGFTEWTNVTKAKPLFEGHYQPQLPADLGFYDLRLPEVREQQAQLAKKYGIHGFCYYHYWFNGKRILDRPFQEVYESGKPDFPFMLCWANENWTRVWDGGEKNILLKQSYSEEDDRNHIKTLLPVFKDERYIKIDGKPVFAFYRSSLFPDLQKTINTWREEAAKEGLELYLCRFETFADEGDESLKAGFDAAIEFQPHGFFGRKELAVKTLKDEISISTIWKSIVYRVGKLKNKLFPPLPGHLYKYEDIVQYSLSERPGINGYKRYRSVCPGWDNSPRKKNNFFILLGSTPALFGYWVKNVLKQFIPYSKEENLFFINAWNEWAEGNHLEPCQKWGNAYLEELLQNLEAEVKKDKVHD